MKPLDIEISHPDKILFPDSGITKKELADYYRRIADRLLPWIKNRPLTFKTFPDGIGKDGFFNKHAPDHFPDFIPRIKVPMRGQTGAAHMASANEDADLAYFAGQNIIELHVALAQAGSLEIPDQLIFDFDPADDNFENVRTAGLAFKEFLDDAGLPAFVKITGSKGIHVHIPLRPESNFETAKPWAKILADRLHQKIPDCTTLEQRKNKRGNKVFIDVLRNEYGQTSIAPYAVRARPHAPIATPIDWPELKNKNLTPHRYTIKNLFRRLSQCPDPWNTFAQSRISSSRLQEVCSS